MNQFGGDWTAEKLDIIEEYLSSYTIALSKQRWQKVYIDLFAGTGEVHTNSNVVIPGSVQRSLRIKNGFDRYFFIEKDPQRYQELLENLSHWANGKNVRPLCGDANQIIVQLTQNEINSKQDRGVVFLDPFALNVSWETLKTIAETGCLDLWYLFPTSAITRCLPYDKDIPQNTRDRLSTILGGDEWFDLFYKPRYCRQMSLFDNEYTDSEFIRQAGTEAILKYLLTNLQKIFPFVSQKPHTLRNSRKAPLFHLVFAVSNKSERAYGLANKIASSILNKHS